MSSGSRKRSRPATLADVGRAAGVSAMAASAVLNGARTSSRIAVATRERILAAAKRLNYRANAAARALAASRMHSIGVAAVYDSGELNQYFLEVFNGVIEGAAAHEQNTTVFTLHDWDADALARLPRFCDGRIDGMILIAPLTSEALAQALPDHTPFVSIHANWQMPGVLNLETDEEAGAYTMVRHLITQGHQRIMHLAGPHGKLGAERRVCGYRRAHTDAGIAVDEELVVEADFSSAGGYRTFRSWLHKHSGGPLPQAVFCCNDACAVGCLEALAEAGISVPGDISLAGFDDTLAARTTVPQLTTVRQPLRAIGRQAAECLLMQVRNQHSHGNVEPQTSIVFPTELVVRASVATPPTGAVPRQVSA